MWTKRERGNPLMMEAKKIFLNQVKIDENGHFRVVDERRVQLWGAADGEAKVRFSGLTVREFFYRTEYNETKALYAAREAMFQIGRGVDMKCMEEAAACLVRAHIFLPVLIVFFVNAEGKLQLTTLTPRSIFAPWAVNSALNKFDQHLPDEIKRNLSVHSMHDIRKTLAFHVKKKFSREALMNDGEFLDMGKVRREREKDTEKKKVSRGEAALEKAARKAEAKKLAADRRVAKKEAALKKAMEKAAALREDAGGTGADEAETEGR